VAIFLIEEACRADLPQILAIYNEVIRNTTAVYSEVELDQAAGEAWFDAKADKGLPLIVARDASGVVGLGTLSDFRVPPCYAHSVEHSVHVRADRRGAGVGRAIVIELLVRAARLRKHAVLAAVDADNAASLALHASLGFESVGRFREVGFKFGRWLDLVFLQRMISATPETVSSTAENGAKKGGAPQ
jgi:L-amino acid N-acyltransferase YncA